MDSGAIGAPLETALPPVALENKCGRELVPTQNQRMEGIHVRDPILNTKHAKFENVQVVNDGLLTIKL